MVSKPTSSFHSGVILLRNDLCMQKTILIVEDEFLIAIDLQLLLEG